jgi:hypothetical protein
MFLPQMVFDSFFNTTMWASGAPSSNVRFRSQRKRGNRPFSNSIDIPLVRCWVVVRKFKEDGLEFLKCEVNFMYSQVDGNSMLFINRVVNRVYSLATGGADKEPISRVIFQPQPFQSRPLYVRAVD